MIFLPLLLDVMVAIPAGSFTQGHAHGRADEAPAHRVDVAAFELDATLVTRAAFAAFVQATGYVTTAERRGYGIGTSEGLLDWTWERIPGASWRRPFRDEDADTASFLRDDAPVTMVSWDDASAYCRAARKRLPTEVEWEYAMRAGSTARYPWGDDPHVRGALALNFWQGPSHRRNLREDGWVYVSPVRTYAPNAWGVYDPVGNVWQWTADFYAPDAYRRGTPSRGEKRVLRGGSWWCGACTCEGNGLFYRGKADPRAAFDNNGFRCAR